MTFYSTQHRISLNAAKGRAMVELPSGTVTFLFTDIEGSTQLVKRLGDRYADVLAEHQQLIRAAAEERGGRVVDTQGDSFFLAFPRANAAVGAAVVAQRALAEHDWPEGGDVRVRMGLHTGEPLVGEERYVGIGVHRAARIGAAGHGGQVLLSNATRELVEDEVGGVLIRDLGTYRLKDIDRPERLYQLDVEGLQTEFPPLKAEKVSEPRAIRRRTALLAGLAGVLAATIAIPIFALGQGGSGDTLEALAGNSVGIVDPESGRIVGDIAVGTAPTNVAFGEGAAWVTNGADATVDRIDPETRTVRQTIGVGKGPDEIAVGAGSVWVTNGFDGTVSRIDPRSNTEIDRIPVGIGPSGIALGFGAVWVVNRDDHTLTRIDAGTGKPERTTPVGSGPVDVAAGAGSIWLTSANDGQLLKIDPRTVRESERVNVGRGPESVAFGHGSVWVANTIDGTVSRVDPEDFSVRALIDVGDGPSGLAIDSDAVWVSNELDSSLSRIDPSTNDVTSSIAIGARPSGVALDPSGVYVAARPSGPAHRGGTLTFIEHDTDSKYRSLDPALIAFPGTARLLQMTNDGLTAFRRIGGAEGAQVAPNLATTVPRPTDGGKTYTFRIRPGIRYSTGRPVRASDFRHAFERVFRLGGEYGTFFLESLVGARACTAKPKRCNLANGVVVDDKARTVTLHLTKPDPELPAKLAFPFLVAVPGNRPSRDTGTTPLPATGPYLIASFSPGRQVRLVRNPRFREWSPTRPDGYPDEIVIRLDASEKGRVRAVARGEADATTLSRGAEGTQDLADLRERYGSQLHANPTAGSFSIFLNTRVPPFDDIRVRRALNYAVDRQAAMLAFGGPEWGSPLCQVLPPSIPGHRPYCPYERDLAEARRLVAASGTRGASVAVLTREFAIPMTRPVISALRGLGYSARMDLVSDEEYFRTYASEDVQAGIWGWQADYPSAATWIPSQYGCAGNQSHFCDRRVDREIEKTIALQASNPAAANEAWATIDRMLTDRAPLVHLFSAQLPYFVSERVGNYQYHPVHELLLDQLWVR
jgi:YVTN family beta-propeller protein